MPILTPIERLGTVVGGRYELREAIGEGASAVLFAAQDRRLDRQVGVKVMRHAGSLATPQDRARFQREAQTLTRLRHPHLVDVFDVGETDDGVPYVVMELLHGETLAARLARTSTLSISEALAVALPLMGALACAHDVGIIHRDIKPANIFLVRREGGAIVPKLLDFGIAKLEGEPAMTSDGMTLGTPAFMAPEQARGEPLKPAADVWAMGVTLFACLSGRLPFDAPTAAGVLMQAMRTGTPRLEVAELDRNVALVIERSLVLEVQRRIPTMRALARAFAQTGRRAGIALPSDPDPVGLPEFKLWCRHADAELATDEMAVAPTQSLPVLAEPLPAPAADSSSAMAVVRSPRRVLRFLVPLVGAASLAGLWLWRANTGSASPKSTLRAPAVVVDAGPAKTASTVATPALPAGLTRAAAPLAPEPRDGGLEAAAPAPAPVSPKRSSRAKSRAKPRAKASPTQPLATEPPPKPAMRSWDF